MEQERKPTGSEVLDQLLDGGLEPGIITNFYGDSGTGKTAAAVQASAKAAESGKVAYIDTEGGFSPERFAQVGEEEDLEDVKIKNPTTFEEQQRSIESLENVEADLVVVDSLVALYRIERDGEDVSEANQMLSDQLSKLSAIARNREIPVIVTNQVYTRFETEKLELVGKDVPRYWSKCLVKMEKNPRKAVIEKHRSLPPGRKRRFQITEKGLEPREENEEGLF